jgi:glutathione S-transferase
VSIARIGVRLEIEMTPGGAVHAGGRGGLFNAFKSQLLGKEKDMKLYNHSVAPNPRRVRLFAAEKEIQLSLEEVDLLAGRSRTPEFLAKNSSGGVPVLELDDGSYLSESVAICRYFEGLRPEPNLFGRDLKEQVQIEMWNRRMEHELLDPVGRALFNTNLVFQGLFTQFQDYGEAQRAIAYQRLERMDRELEGANLSPVIGSRSRILPRWSRSTSAPLWETYIWPPSSAI